ncbi:hypothetical protein KEM52_006205 [Ascosphaera acerosa]|nr:hypothetical protein KEM52_006205 [Ascosphaera acerosa]
MVVAGWLAPLGPRKRRRGAAGGDDGDGDGADDNDDKMGGRATAASGPGRDVAATDPGGRPAKKSRLQGRDAAWFNTVGASDGEPETVDISEEVERRLRLKEEKRRQRRAGRQTKRKREDGGPDGAECHQACGGTLRKRVRTGEEPSASIGAKDRKRRASSDLAGHHKRRALHAVHELDAVQVMP